MIIDNTMNKIANPILDIKISIKPERNIATAIPSHDSFSPNIQMIKITTRPKIAKIQLLVNVWIKYAVTNVISEGNPIVKKSFNSNSALLFIKKINKRPLKMCANLVST